MAGPRALQGSLSQMSPRFGEASRGRQCTAIAAVALCRLLLDGPHGWSADDVDQCVILGDWLYRQSWADGQLQRARAHRGTVRGAVEYLDPWEVYTTVQFPTWQVRFSVDQKNEIHGSLRELDGLMGPLQALDIAFKEHSAVFLTTCAFTIGLWQSDDGKVWLFDSHCRGADGLVDGDGTAVLVSLRSVEELVQHLLRLFPPQTSRLSDLFFLVGLEVVSVTDADMPWLHCGLPRTYASALTLPPPVRETTPCPQPPQSRRQEEWPALPAARSDPAWASSRASQVAPPRARRRKERAHTAGLPHQRRPAPLPATPPPPSDAPPPPSCAPPPPSCAPPPPSCAPSPPMSLPSDDEGVFVLRDWVSFHPELFMTRRPAAAPSGPLEGHSPQPSRPTTALSGPVAVPATASASRPGVPSRALSSRPPATAQPAPSSSRPVVSAASASTDTDLPPSRGAGRPPKRKRGRPKASDLTQKEQQRERAKRYREVHPDARLASVQRYTENHPEVNRAAVQRYTESHPEVNRAAVQRYTESHPQVHRAATRRHDQQHLEQRRERAARYERATVRHLPQPLRGRDQLIGEFRGDDLRRVKTFSLKKQSLLAPDIHRCPKCDAPLFEEEKQRTAFCCRNGAFNVQQQQLPPLDAAFYTNREFLRRPGRYNDAFAFSASVIPGGWQHPRGGLSFMRMQGRMYHKVYDVNWRGPYPNTSAMYVDSGEERQQYAETQGLDVHLALAIADFLNNHNRLIPYYRQLGQMDAPNARLVFEATTRQEHGAALEQPTSREVAILMASEEAPYNPRQITIWKSRQDSQPQNVHVFHPLYEAFQYPLLYPEGTVGWYPGRTDNNGNKLSQLDYVRCLLLSNPRFTQFGRLSEAWLVDMWGRIEEERLRFHYREQEAGASGTLRGAPMDEILAAANRQQPGQPAQVPAGRGRGRGRGRGSQAGGWGSRGRGRGRGAQPPGPTAPSATPVNSLPGFRPTVRGDVANDETIQGEGFVPGRIYLPQSFTGGPRYMRARYRDAMAIVGRHGRPSYLLTITANGQWPEIRQSVHPNNPSGEPMVVDRVFQLKLLELLRDLRSGAFFGKPVYIIYVIEFQKRGLPHAHICFRVEGGGPIQSDEIDRFIRADIPSADEDDGNLQALVLQHMVHGPICENKPCWDKNKRVCTKFFPKPHTDVTYIDERGFVHYKRNSANKVPKRVGRQEVIVSDCNVVPYNAALLKKYDCHINLEVASSRKVVKYLFKYLHKGSPLARTTLAEGEQVDEINEFVTQRFIGASDAAWRILEFGMTYHQPAVVMLPIHLENREFLLFERSRLNDAANASSSKLVLYLKRPRIAQMDNLTYVDFYERYRVITQVPPNSRTPVFPYDDGKHFVKERLAGGADRVVARMHWQDPSRGEVFYLRLLLSSYPCRSFEELKALGGPACTSFQQAARALGLADDQEEYGLALTEAHGFMLGRRLRSFFVTLLNVGAPGANLWADFKDIICEDLLEDHPQDPDRAYALALQHIERELRRHGSSLQDHGLPEVAMDFTEAARERDDLSRNAPRRSAFVEDWEPRLSDEQRAVLQYVRGLSVAPAPAETQPRVLFLDAPGGYGKSALLQVVAADARARKEIVLCVASSGIAALNLEGGTTAHNMFRLPLDFGDGLGYWNLTNGSQRAQLIREASIIIFDEAPMAHRYLLEILDRSLQDLMGNQLRFGGKIVLFSGDFRQIPPVVTNAKTPSDVINASPRSSYLWDGIKVFNLTQPQRTRGHPDFAQFLLNIGNDEVEHHIFGEEGNQRRLVAIPEVQPVGNLQELIAFVFPPEVITDPDACVNRAVLSTHNINVQEINDTVLASLPGDMHHLCSVDKVHGDMQALDVDQDTLHMAKGKNVPSHILDLKVGAVCTIMRNLNITERLVNGTKVIVEAITPRVVRVRRPGSNESIAIPRINFVFPVYDGGDVQMCRRQFPLQVCYGMTVHRSQGQTIERAGLDLRSDCFTHGQLYVMLSRVRSPQDVRVLVPPDHVEDNIAFAQNIVYRQLLQGA